MNHILASTCGGEPLPLDPMVLHAADVEGEFEPKEAAALAEQLKEDMLHRRFCLPRFECGGEAGAPPPNADLARSIAPTGRAQQRRTRRR